MQQNTSAVMPHICFHSLPSAARSSLSSLIGCLIYRKLDQTCRNLSGGLSSWITFFMSSAECNQRVWKALTRMQRSFIGGPVAGYGRIFTRWNRVFHQENWKLVCHKKINFISERCFHLDNYRDRPRDKASYEIKFFSHTARVVAQFRFFFCWSPFFFFFVFCAVI